MNKKQKAVSVALAAVFACGTLAGCDALTTVDSTKDYAQVIAEVDLSKESEFEAYKEVLSPAKITKRDLVASYVSSGYSLQQQYGWSYSQIFPTLARSLANRELYVQYAKVHFLEESAKNNGEYTTDGYKAAIAGDGSDAEREAKGIAYFLDDEKKAKAEYDLKVSINSNLDSYEEDIIKLETSDSDTTPDSDVRTLPTGAETENEDYYTENYAIWTGKEGDSALGDYEKLDGSTRTTRRKAYIKYLSNLRLNALIDKSENTSELENTDYYWTQLRSAYAAALIEKLTDEFETQSEGEINETYAKEAFAEDSKTQASTYAADRSAFESSLDGISDSSFVLASPTDSKTQENDAYGFVINILLPFSDLQTQALGEVSTDFGDVKGNKFAARARLLKAIEATDQRGTWFTGKTDYSFEAGEDAYTAGDENREWLFFENSFEESDKYEIVEKYFGKYTYNGTVTKTTDDDGDTEYTITPNKITIDGFLSEMKGYLSAAMKDFGGGEIDYTIDGGKQADRDTYYTPDTFYKDNGDVDYSKFIYEMGRIAYFEEEATPYDAGNIFVKDKPENIALSVINELSFAYNTDTGGLNSYLGYSVSPYKTSYMSEFEYAAQLVVKEGAGTYAVVPTDYGWHIIYCTFSFADTNPKARVNSNGDNYNSPFEFQWEDIKQEGTFSYQYFESLKSTAISTAASNRQTRIISAYSDACTTVYESRFKDLMDLG